MFFVCACPGNAGAGGFQHPPHPKSGQLRTSHPLPGFPSRWQRRGGPDGPGGARTVRHSWRLCELLLAPSEGLHQCGLRSHAWEGCPKPGRGRRANSSPRGYWHSLARCASRVPLPGSQQAFCNICSQSQTRQQILDNRVQTALGTLSPCLAKSFPKQAGFRKMFGGTSAIELGFSGVSFV